MGVFSGNICRTRLFLEYAGLFIHHMMNFLTWRGVRSPVMHRGRSLTVFSASLFGINWMLGPSPVYGLTRIPCRHFDDLDPSQSCDERQDGVAGSCPCRGNFRILTSHPLTFPWGWN